MPIRLRGKKISPDGLHPGPKEAGRHGPASDGGRVNLQSSSGAGRSPIAKTPAGYRRRCPQAGRLAGFRTRLLSQIMPERPQGRRASVPAMRGLDSGEQDSQRSLIEPVQGHDAGLQDGLNKGHDAGFGNGLLQRIVDLCEVLGIEVTQKRRDQLGRLDEGALLGLRDRLKRDRSWPAEIL